MYYFPQIMNQSPHPKVQTHLPTLTNARLVCTCTCFYHYITPPHSESNYTDWENPKKKKAHRCKSNLKLKSYGITCTNCERGSLPLLSRHLTASLRNSLGSCRQTQSSNDSKSLAKSSRYQSNSLGTINLFVSLMPNAACKYSLFATSNSSSTPDDV